MRVVLLIDGLSPHGGGERLAMQIALRLDPERFERTLCVSRWHPRDMERTGVPAAIEELNESGVELMLLDRSSPRDLGAWRPLWQRMRSGQVDVLHAHKFGSNVWAAALGRTAGVPVVLTHEHNWSYEGQSLRRILDRQLIARRSDAFMAVSRENLRRMIEDERIDPARLMFIANGIPAVNGLAGGDLRPELGIGRDDPVIGTVAVLREEKAVHLLVRAAAQLVPEFPALKVVVAGDGPELAGLQSLAAELGVADAFRWLGMREDVPRVLGVLDVAVLSSIWEGSPLSVMEFMQAGKPVVATRVGGVPELVEHERTGLLVEPGDPAGLAGAIGRLLRDREFAAEAGRLGRERQQAEFDLDLMVRRLENVYTRLYDEKTGGKAPRRRTATSLGHEPAHLELLGDPAAAREHWQALAERCPNVFSTWEWADAWWGRVGAGEPLVTLARRGGADGEPFALLPLYLAWERPARVVRLIGQGPADRLGPVCAPEDRADAMAAMARAVAEFADGYDLFLAERIAADQDWRAALGAERLRREELPLLRFDGGFEQFLESRSKNFRQQVRKRERRLAREFDLSFRLAGDPARLGDDLSTLIRLHRERWAGAADAFTGPREEFHRDFAARALERGWLRLWLLELDGEPRAAWYGFRYGGADSSYQIGRDPAFDRSSLGFVLQVHSIRDCLDSGIGVYSHLVGDEEYKDRLANDAEQVDTLAAAPTLRGRSAVKAYRGARNLPGSVRGPLRRVLRG
jgi:glycosyltransferase involved in cell wall biosynthesis/CelD/BcsL family acetyltransferase involved in cellulose biosynthesis